MSSNSVSLLIVIDGGSPSTRTSNCKNDVEVRKPFSSTTSGLITLQLHFLPANMPFMGAGARLNSCFAKPENSVYLLSAAAASLAADWGGLVVGRLFGDYPRLTID